MKAITTLMLLGLFVLKSNAQCTYTSSVPYFEDFSSITAAGQLPTCWAVSNTVNCQTAISPSHAAVFYSNPPGSFYYYTNGIQLYSGVVYTVSLNYISDAFAPANWNNLAIMIGTAQAAASQSVVTQSSSIAGFAMTALGGTFSVNSSGIYYSAIRAIATSTSPSTLLAFSNFSIDIPCSISANQPSVSISTPSLNVCSGTTVFLTASGAAAYSWGPGKPNATNTISPVAGINTYSVVGYSAVTGCSSSAVISLTASPSPTVHALSLGVRCVGVNDTIFAIGATTYSWSNGVTTNSFVFTSTVQGSQKFVVTGTTGTCTGSSTVFASSVPKPVVSVSVKSFTVCDGAGFLVAFSGAFTFSLDGLSVAGSTVLTPSSDHTYTLTGHSTCDSDPIQFSATVVACTGLPSISTELHLDAFPNPSSGQFSIEMDVPQKMEVFNASGQLIIHLNGAQKTELDLRPYPAGIYLLKAENGKCQKLIVSH